MNVDMIKNTNPNAEFDPNSYSQDIEFNKQTSEYKWETTQYKVLERMMAFDNAKTSVTNTKARWDRASYNSSRSSSPARSFVMRGNADSMKPNTLAYNSATLVNVKDHLRRVDDWMANLYPSGYSFSLFKSNFNITIDSEF